jgi:hypothetical protein
MRGPEHAEYPIGGVASPRTVRRPGVSCEGQTAQSRRNGGLDRAGGHVSHPERSLRRSRAEIRVRAAPRVPESARRHAGTSSIRPVRDAPAPAPALVRRNVPVRRTVRAKGGAVPVNPATRHRLTTESGCRGRRGDATGAAEIIRATPKTGNGRERRSGQLTAAHEHHGRTHRTRPGLVPISPTVAVRPRRAARRRQLRGPWRSTRVRNPSWSVPGMAAWFAVSLPATGGR